MNAVEKRLQELGLTLPEPVAPVANYVPYVISGSQVFISGQVSVTVLRTSRRDGHVSMCGSAVLAL